MQTTYFDFPQLWLGGVFASSSSGMWVVHIFNKKKARRKSLTDRIPNTKTENFPMLIATSSKRVYA